MGDGLVRSTPARPAQPIPHCLFSEATAQGSSRVFLRSTRAKLAALMRKSPHSPRLGGKKRESRQRVTISTPGDQTKSGRKFPSDQSDGSARRNFFELAPRVELKKLLSLPYQDVSRSLRLAERVRFPRAAARHCRSSGGFGKTRPAGKNDRSASASSLDGDGEGAGNTRE